MLARLGAGLAAAGIAGLAAALVLLLAASPSHAAGRVALVVGNNAYRDAPLLNPVNDARAMAQALQAAGFNVVLKTDATQPELLAAVRDFGNRLQAGGAGTAGLFYFAGHGMQIKGRNFLIPVGANIEHEDEVGYQALDAQAVLDKMESAGNGINFMVLDACRNNPFARSFRSARQGLAQMEQPVGTLVAYATAPGSVASDGTGSANGLYTQHLLQLMRQPGMKVEDVFKQVRGAVRRESGGKQVPMEWSSLEGDFYFTPPAADLASSTPAAPAAALTAPGPAVDPQAAIDEALWSAVKDSNSSAEIFAYLNRFPGGLHAREARTRLADLSAPRPLAAGATTGTALAAALPARNQDLVSAAPDTLSPLEREARNQRLLKESSRQQEETARWGSTDPSPPRPANPRRNPMGLAEGDRFRYLLSDLTYLQAPRHYLWRVDRVDADGGLWVNGGRQRLDVQGQRRAGNDEGSGEWIEWNPPVPVATLAAQGAGQNRAVETTVQVRDAAGLTSVIQFAGTVRTSADGVRGPGSDATLLPAVKLTLDLQGSSTRSDGVVRPVRWIHTFWFAKGVPLPVEMEIAESSDSVPTRHLRHNLVAVDALSVPATLASSGP